MNIVMEEKHVYERAIEGLVLRVSLSLMSERACVSFL
jgi:hypothetical protein